MCIVMQKWYFTVNLKFCVCGLNRYTVALRSGGSVNNSWIYSHCNSGLLRFSARKGHLPFTGSVGDKWIPSNIFYSHYILYFVVLALRSSTTLMSHIGFVILLYWKFKFKVNSFFRTFNWFSNHFRPLFVWSLLIMDLSKMLSLNFAPFALSDTFLFPFFTNSFVRRWFIFLETF